MAFGDLNQPESGRGVFLLKQSANIYTAMLILAFVFITIGCLFLFLEMKAYNLSIKVPADAKVPQAMWTPAAHPSLVASGPMQRLHDRQDVSIL
jgi:hypothetical protein